MVVNLAANNAADNNAQRSICMLVGISADPHRAINKFVSLLHYSFATVLGPRFSEFSLSLNILF